MGLNGSLAELREEREGTTWRTGFRRHWSEQVAIVTYIDKLSKACQVNPQGAVDLIRRAMGVKAVTRNATLEWVKSEAGKKYLENQAAISQSQAKHVSRRRRQIM